MKNALFWPFEPDFPNKLCPISVRNCKLRIIMLYEIRNFHSLKPLIPLYFLPFQLHSVRSAPIPSFSIPSYLKQAENLSKIDIFFLPLFVCPLFATFLSFSSLFYPIKKDPKHFPCLESSFFFSRFMRFFPGHYAGFVREVNITPCPSAEYSVPP